MPDPSAVCAACSLLLAGLSRVAEISAPAHSISKRPSPNAHTQRWLQGVDKVSVRAEVEDELELVCGRLALRSVRDECVELVETLGLKGPHAAAVHALKPEAKREMLKMNTTLQSIRCASCACFLKKCH